jgi:hypothetical protein
MAEILTADFGNDETNRRRLVLSPARQRLRQAITVLAAAQREAEAAAEPVARLNAIITEASQLRAEFDVLMRRDLVATGEWIPWRCAGHVRAECSPGRPGWRHRGHRRVLPAKQEAHRQAIECTTAAVVERNLHEIRALAPGVATSG